MDHIESLEQTFQHAHRVIGSVRPDQYDNKTPCEEWTVRDLLEHAIGVVAGLGAAASGTPGSPLKLGSDPAAQFQQAAISTLAAWRTPGVFDQILDIGAGPMPGRVLAGINLDTATHTWDIATATGQSTQLPDDVATSALEVSRATISPEIRPGRFVPNCPRRVVGGARQTARSREGSQPVARRARPATPAAAVGANRQGVPLHRRRGRAHAARPVRRTQPVACVPLMSARPGRRLPQLLVLGRQFRRRRRARRPPRRHLRLRVTGTVRQARRL